MIPDPATTPLKPIRQGLFGLAVAALYGVIQVLHLVFGLFFGWFRAPALLAGWLAGFAGGTALAWINGLKPLHALTLAQSSVTIYIGLLALAANVVVAVIANVIMTAVHQEAA